MIERIETTYKKYDNISMNLFSEEQRKIFLDKLKPQINDIIKNNDKLFESVYSRLSEIACSATVETRAEKLYKILRQCFHIDKICKGLMEFEISCEKTQEFIDLRNTLCHGKSMEKYNYTKIVKLCN